MFLLQGLPHQEILVGLVFLLMSLTVLLVTVHLDNTVIILLALVSLLQELLVKILILLIILPVWMAIVRKERSVNLFMMMILMKMSVIVSVFVETEY